MTRPFGDILFHFLHLHQSQHLVTCVSSLSRDPPSTPTPSPTPPPVPSPTQLKPGLDVGLYVKKPHVDADLKRNLPLNTYIPPPSYAFKRDSTAPRSRCFRHTWLAVYAPWLADSIHLKGNLSYSLRFRGEAYRKHSLLELTPGTRTSMRLRKSARPLLGTSIRLKMGETSGTFCAVQENQFSAWYSSPTTNGRKPLKTNS